MLQDFYKPHAGGEPVYLQIIRQFKLLLLQEIVQHEDEMPSIRMLAVRLGVNPMTVQKAYTELEAMGLIRGLTGKQRVVDLDETKLNVLRAEIIEREVMGLVSTAMSAGISADALAKMVTDAYGRFQL